MTNDVKNIPELRFPGFENTWEKKKFFDILKSKGEGVKRGPFGGALKKEIFKNSGFAIYEQKNAIYDNQHFRYFIDEEKYNEMIGFAVKQGDIIMSCSGTIGKLSLIPEDAKIGIINQALIRFRTNNTILNTYFLIYMRSQYMQKKILESNPGSAITNLIPVKELKLLNFPLPNINEQKKLGSFFCKLDQQIELEEQKLAKLEKQKKGYMQQIFSQQLRFKDENGNDYLQWNITTIEKIAKVSKGFTPSTKDINLWQNDNKNWLSIAGMGDKYIYEGNKGISSAGEEKHKKVNEDTLIMSFKLTLGKVAIVKKPIYTNEAICHFEWNTNQIKTDYMYYYLSFTNIKSFGSQAVKGITLNNDSINSIVIKLPEFLEQSKIGNFFNKCDELIEKQNQKIDALKLRKKGFLQKMFM